MVEMHETPVIELAMIVNSGAATDPAGQFGVAHFTAEMLDEGAGSRSALELSDAVDFLGASLSTSSSFDASQIRLHSLSSKIDDALPLFADVTMRPTFPETELARLRQERLTTLMQLRDNPSQLASAAFARVLYGPAHRYGTPVMGTEATNTRLASADLKAFYAAHYHPANATLLVVGDVAPGAFLPQLERAFGAWPARPVPARPSWPDPSPAERRRVFLLDKPGAAQSEIRIGALGVARTTPDYFPITVMNTILGGSFSSRLNMNLRERNQFSYGASSSFAMRRMTGPFVAAAGVQTDKTSEALQEFFKELQGMSEPVPAGELTRVKNLEALSFPSSFETTRDVASHLTELVVHGLPESFLTGYVRSIQSVTAADVQRAARQYLASARFVTVIVGDRSKIEAPLRASGFGDLEVVSQPDVLK
jgi:predicted Zn-dependent peptidase